MKGYSKKNYRVKKPVRTFRDLEIYRITEELSVKIIKEIIPLIKESTTGLKEKLSENSLDIPVIISKAYSLRFEDKPASIEMLRKAMDKCNETVVYLEQIRDIHSEDIPVKNVNEVIKRYIFGRRKILNLKKAWVKFDKERKLN